MGKLSSYQTITQLADGDFIPVVTAGLANRKITAANAGIGGAVRLLAPTGSAATDLTTTQALIDELYAAGGGEILCGAGKWEFENALRMKDNVRIRGLGHATHFDYIDSTPDSTTGAFVIAGSNVSISDLRLTHTLGNTNMQCIHRSGESGPVSNIRIERLDVSGFVGFCRMHEATEVFVGDNVVELDDDNAGWNAIMVANGSSYWTIDGNQISGASEEGISVDITTSGTWGVDEPHHVTISNNQVSNCGRTGIIAYRCHNVTITGNVVDGVTDAGFAGIATSTDAAEIFNTNITITGNTVKNTVTEGIRCGSTKVCAISGNTVDGVAGDSSSSGGTGIWLGSNVVDIAVSGNVVRNVGANSPSNNDNRAGIRAHGTNVTVAGNIVEDTTVVHGIIGLAANCTISGNVVTGAGGAGIRTTSAFSGTVTGNVAEGALGDYNLEGSGVHHSNVDSTGRCIDPVAPSGLWLPGSSGEYVSCPDSAGVSITGDLTLVACIAPDDWTPSGSQVIIAKRSSDSQYSFLFVLGSSGQLQLRWSPDGTEGNALLATSTVSLSALGAGEMRWVAATLDVDAGSSNREIRFWTSFEGSRWFQLGDTIGVAGTTSIFDSTSPVELGSQGGGTVANFAGLILAASIRSGIGTSGVPGGTEVAEWSGGFARGDRYRDGYGNLWTAAGTATAWMAA